MFTKEERVKKIVSSYLKELDENGVIVYAHMEVPTGYGKRNSLDYTLCIAGRFVAIETKGPGKWLTPLQRQTCRNILQAGGAVFIISGPDGLNAFKRWVGKAMQTSKHQKISKD